MNREEQLKQVIDQYLAASPEQRANIPQDIVNNVFNEYHAITNSDPIPQGFRDYTTINGQKASDLYRQEIEKKRNLDRIRQEIAYHGPQGFIDKYGENGARHALDLVKSNSEFVDPIAYREAQQAPVPQPKRTRRTKPKITDYDPANPPMTIDPRLNNNTEGQGGAGYDWLGLMGDVAKTTIPTAAAYWLRKNRDKLGSKYNNIVQTLKTHFTDPKTLQSSAGEISKVNPVATNDKVNVNNKVGTELEYDNKVMPDMTKTANNSSIARNRLGNFKFGTPNNRVTPYDRVMEGRNLPYNLQHQFLADDVKNSTLGLKNDLINNTASKMLDSQGIKQKTVGDIVDEIKTSYGIDISNYVQDRTSAAKTFQGSMKPAKIINKFEPDGRPYNNKKVYGDVADYLDPKRFDPKGFKGIKGNGNVLENLLKGLK